MGIHPAGEIPVVPFTLPGTREVLVRGEKLIIPEHEGDGFRGTRPRK